MRKTAWRGASPGGKARSKWSAWRCVRGGGGQQEGGGASVYVCTVRVHPAGLHLRRPRLFWIGRVCSNLPHWASLQAFFPFFFFYHPLATMHVSFSLSCLPLPPYVSFSLSITFSGSPGQAVKCCNLSLSPILTLPPSLAPPPLLSRSLSWIRALTTTTTCKRGKSLTESERVEGGWGGDKNVSQRRGVKPS